MTAFLHSADALGDSELQFWEITAVKPGSYAELRHYGTTDKSIRVKERAATESLHQWDGLVARVLHIAGNHVFSGAMLPFRPDLAARIQSVLSAIPEQTRQLVQELIDKGDMEDTPENLEEMIRFKQESELAGVSFLIWAMDIYIQSMRPSPALRNMDDEPIEPTGVRFPLRGGRSFVAQALDEPIPMLDGLSPRQCAADPARRDEVVGWLRHLENSNKRASGPVYDFSWMWDELNLTRN